MKPRILHVVSEVAPWVKTGGLADVAGALPRALRQLGYDARLVVPGYPAILEALEDRHVVGSDPDLFQAGPAQLVAGTLGEVPAFVVDAPGHFARDGLYVDSDGHEHPDNAQRFAALGWAAAAVVNAFRIGEQDSVLHLHDWQAGLAAAYVRYGPRPDTPILTTIHNLAYQGRFSVETFEDLGLPKQALSIYGVEYYGGIGYLKTGLYYADAISTVSPTYAREIQSAESGHGLDGLLRSRANRLFGVLNGIDVDVWNPRTDSALPRVYDETSIAAGKHAAREALCDRLGIVPSEGPWLGIVSRLAWAKGIDRVLDAIGSFPTDARLVILGAGDRELERRIDALAGSDSRVFAHLGYDEALAHQIMGASDFLLVPSREEPCGLTQLYAMRYGTIPIARAVGGLADTVIDGETGVAFEGEALPDAIVRALALRSSKAWEPLRRSVMRIDHSWTSSAARYAEIYESLVRREAVPITSGGLR